jgi:two-component system sensor histidine kinase YesM
MRKWFRKRSVFVMLLSIFLVVMIPMYILGFGIYSWGHGMTRQEITNSLNSTVSFYIRTLESEIQRIRELQFECLNDSNLFYYVNASNIMTQFQRISALLSLQNRLSVMRDSSHYILDAILYLPRNGKIISAKGGVDELSDAWKPIVAAKADNSAAGIIYVDGRLYLGAAYPVLPADPDATPLYILIIELSTKDIQDFLLSFNLYEDGGTVLYNENQDYNLSSDDAGEVVDHIQRDEQTAKAIHMSGEASVSMNNRQYLVVGEASKYLNMELYTYIPETQIYQGIWRYQTLFVVFSIAAFVVVVIFSFACYMLIKKPMNLLVSSLRKVERGDLSTRIEHHVSDEYAYLYDTFNGMASALENLFELNYKQQLLTQRAELRQLQAQINPHFLHNSFFILYRMAKDEDFDNITVFLTYLSDYYRFITRNAQADVKFSSEVTHAYNYARIQQVRFGRRIKMTLEELPQDLADVMVPRLILQPVLENAFDHGLKDVAENGQVNVTFWRENDTIKIAVENNGAPLSDEELADMNQKLNVTDDLQECTGIINIHRRLRLKFGQGSGLKISHGSMGGLKVEIVMRISQNPFNNPDDSHEANGEK